ncbi:hypothetical protein JEQ21_02900 [Streptococcus sp. 121]|uniref:hypothetical protein n=1 Tax=Streptococcus sp. 121 TaxID=2797637 RepID=UPI0018F0F1AF|nr:hypothetical protein [Streptococcus sp. 121]MBJ6745421.1 hypothetical protein [Streptococcus sp. 121]
MTDKRTPQPYDILTDYDRLIKSASQVLGVLEQFDGFKSTQTVAVPVYALRAILDEHRAVTKEYYSAIFAKTN